MLIRKSARPAHRLPADRSGVAAVEFALLLPLLTLMLAGVFQYGMLMYSYNNMLNAARNGARALSTSSATNAEAIAAATADLPFWIPAGEATVTVQNAAINNDVSARIVIPSHYATLMPFGPMPDELDVTVVMLKES